MEFWISWAIRRGKSRRKAEKAKSEEICLIRKFVWYFPVKY